MAIPQATYDIHRSNDRGTTDLDWLHSRHSFSFGQYYAPERNCFRSLRVLNDDIIKPGSGFGRHPHENMEIISWMLAGTLEHSDSSGQRSVIRPGDVQVMTAGRGIEHSEMNASQTETAHFIQIWIEPAKRNLKPAYSQKSFPIEERRSQWQIVAGPDGCNGSLHINQDAFLSIAEFTEGQQLDIVLRANRYGYLHIAFGAVRIDNQTLRAGDSITWAAPDELVVEGLAESQLLFFDLA